MKTCVIVLAITVISICEVNGYLSRILRRRRDAIGGSLDIVSKNVQPIHADVKSDLMLSTHKPCPTGYLPSQIEPGIAGFQVTPPPVIFKKSLRKSLPAPNRMEVVRSISRLAAVLVLAVAALAELYPAIAHLTNLFTNFME